MRLTSNVYGRLQGCRGMSDRLPVVGQRVLDSISGTTAQARTGVDGAATLPNGVADVWE